MQNYYKIDIYKQLIQLLPTRRRTPIVMALLLIIASQLQKIHFEFVQFINDFETGVKSQKCYLQAEINKYFDPYQKRIFLRNIAPDFDSKLIWKDANDKFFNLSDETPFLLQKEESMLLNEINFEVVLPSGFSLTTQESNFLSNLVNTHKLPSKKYRIING
jgi:hypothetical protein